ncbi:hypothetical protein SASPL_115681 [Salvia splendens]|uniref:Uncharacterized protein n=1 Tax=Salvia splendens TaxID=180675 RepID=A0A8X8Y5I9_SALSN|nr:uncharacterized protein LOC121802243 [Salvia splendens]KAG6425254.1 hypothetical protein SASPL_115681 [Salvia splendens]
MDFQLQELEYEYDVFYSELRKQVLQLTAEDDDDDVQEHKIKNSNAVAAQKEGRRGYYDWPQHNEEVAAPTWIMNASITGNGTGVFIPQIVQSRRKNRSRRKRNERGQTNKGVEKTED